MHKQVVSSSDQGGWITPAYASRWMTGAVPKYTLPGGSMPPDQVYQIIADELMLEGNAHMNLATFVTTWMEPTAKQLMTETLEKNLIDKDEYAQTAEIERRCVSIIADLWHAPDNGTAVGSATIGSSEACLLAGLALKWRWRAKSETAKNAESQKPNLVLGSNAQVCWEKFCRYFDVEARFIPLEEGRYHIDPDLAAAACDQNTIGVVGILGSTLDGSYEPIAALCERLDSLEEQQGLSIPVHVDAASGGFVAPFLQPDTIWDFRLLRIKSINASGHKYGLVYPGVGWIVWRHPDDLPQELVFNVNYLGGDMPTFTLNFSRPGNAVLAQYYNFIRLGRDGYTKIHRTSQQTARYIADKLGALGPFSVIHGGSDLPVVAFQVRSDHKLDLHLLSDALRKYGWQVPAYALPDNISDQTIMRIVVKENFSRDLADNLIRDIKQELDQLMGTSTPNVQTGFHH